MAKRDQKAYSGEDPRAGQKHSAWAKQTSQVYGKGPDKHHGGFECAVDPGPLIDSEMQRTSNVWQPHIHQATRACRNECTEEHAGDSQQWVCSHYRLSILRVGIMACHLSPSDRPP